MGRSGNVTSGKLIRSAHVEQDEIVRASGECMVDVPAIGFELQNGFKVGKRDGAWCSGDFGDDRHGLILGWLVYENYRCHRPDLLVA